MSAPALQTHGLTVRFGGFTAVDDVHLSIAPGTRHALTPAEAQRLREQGVAAEVLDELAAAEARAARDQATADKVRRATEQAAAEDRARAEAERRRRAYSPYYDPLGPYGRPFYPAYPYGYPGYFGGGVLIRR